MYRQSLFKAWWIKVHELYEAWRENAYLCVCVFKKEIILGETAKEPFYWPLQNMQYTLYVPAARTDLQTADE